MISRRNTLIALIVAAAFSPLSSVLAQTSVSGGSVSITTTTQPSSTIATVSPTVTSESVSSSASDSATPSPSETANDSRDYYPTIPGQSYDDPNQLIDETAQENDAGADGTSDTFINIPLGAQIGIISVVVIVGISGLVASYLWYMRRRKQWELQGRRRSLVPRFSVNARGEFTMSRPIITRKPNVPPTPTAVRDSTNSVSNFIPVDLEKANAQVETDPKDDGPRWKKIFSKK